MILESVEKGTGGTNNSIPVAIENIFTCVSIR